MYQIKKNSGEYLSIVPSVLGQYSVNTVFDLNEVIALVKKQFRADEWKCMNDKFVLISNH